METTKISLEMVNSKLGVMEQFLSTKVGVRVTLSASMMQTYRGPIVHISSEPLNDQLNLPLLSILFKEISIRSNGCFVQGKFLVVDFDFRYTHPDGGGNGHHCLMLCINLENDQVSVLRKGGVMYAYLDAETEEVLPVEY